jgi:hypothetical protein
MMHLQFLRAGKLIFSPHEFGAPHLRGIETALIQLTRALAARGHRVEVFTNHTAETEDNGVHWRPIPRRLPPSDAVIAVNDHALLRHSNAPRRVLWLHNIQPFDKIIRKGGLPALLRYRPVTVVSSDYHAAQLSPLSAPFGRRVIPLGLNEVFLSATDTSRHAPPPVAAFLPQRYRGFDALAAVWKQNIHPVLPDARLITTIAPQPDAPALSAIGIDCLEPLAWPALADKLQHIRVAVFPWDKPETYCLAAAEAAALGIPIITRNTGAVAERVQQGLTGFICNTEAELCSAVYSVLHDDALWRTLHQGALNARGRYENWHAIAARWEQLLNPLG